MRAAPSTIAASTTCPTPVRPRSNSAHAIPNASSIPPPAKSPSTLIGGGGVFPAPARGRPGRAPPPRQRDVVDVVAGRLRVRPVLAPAGQPPVHELRVAGERDV